MKMTEIATGAAGFRAEISRAGGRWRTVKTVLGELSREDLSAGVDVEEFARQVWSAVGGTGRMRLTVAMACGVVVFVDSVCDDRGAGVTAFRHDETVRPAGFVGKWMPHAA